MNVKTAKYPQKPQKYRIIDAWHQGNKLVTDDYLAFVAAVRLGLKAWMLPDLVVELGERGSFTVEVAEAILQAIRPRYHAGVIEHSLVRLREVRKSVESRGTS